MVNRAPEKKLLGIEGLKRLAKDSLIVATGGLSHYGGAYNPPRKLVREVGKEGIRTYEGKYFEKF